MQSSYMIKRAGYSHVLLSLTIALLLVCVLIVFSSDVPLESLIAFFTINLKSKWYVGNMLDKMTLLIFASIGASFAFKVGLFNLGGEGQVYLAAFLTSILLKKTYFLPSLPYFILSLLIVLASLLLLGMFLGALKALYNIDELISSFLLSSLLAPILNFLILDGMKEATSNLLATNKIQEEFLMKSLLYPSTLNASFFIAILLLITSHLFFVKTKIGYHFRMCGDAKEFARFAGFNNNAIIITSMGLSAMFHGLTGFFAIVGTYGLCHINFSHNFGWNAIAISLIAKKNIIYLLPASLFYAYIESSSDALVAKGMISFNISIFFSALVFLFISANFLIRKRPALKETS